MDSKELKKMSRKDMLEILLEQTKRIRELEDELEKANEKLESKKVVFKNAGSLADAALQLSGIFNTAQEAATIYLSNIKELKEDILDDLMGAIDVENDYPEGYTNKVRALFKEYNNDR